MSDDREEQLRSRAYQIWQSEGEPSGREEEHWQEAARQLGAEGGQEAEASASSIVSSDSGRSSEQGQLDDGSTKPLKNLKGVT